MLSRLVKLYYQLRARKKRWERSDIPQPHGVFSHEPYARYDLTQPTLTLSGTELYGCQVIDLIAVLLKCNPYDMVMIDNDTTGVEHVDLIPGIPLMDICDGVLLSTKRG